MIMIVAVIYLFKKKNPASPASHCRHPYNFLAFPDFFSENTLFSSFSSFSNPSGHPAEVMLLIWFRQNRSIENNQCLLPKIDSVSEQIFSPSEMFLGKYCPFSQVWYKTCQDNLGIQWLTYFPLHLSHFSLFPATVSPSFTITLNFEAKFLITSFFFLGLFGRDFSTFFILHGLIAGLLNETGKLAGSCGELFNVTAV